MWGMWRKKMEALPIFTRLHTWIIAAGKQAWLSDCRFWEVIKIGRRRPRLCPERSFSSLSDFWESTFWNTEEILLSSSSFYCFPPRPAHLLRPTSWGCPGTSLPRRRLCSGWSWGRPVNSRHSRPSTPLDSFCPILVLKCIHIIAARSLNNYYVENWQEEHMCNYRVKT